MHHSDKHILFIDHSPSVNTLRLSDAAMTSMKNQSDISIIRKQPLDVIASDIIAASGVLISTTENIGYMAGLTKDVFDRCYNDLLELTAGKPVSVYIRAGLDGTATKTSIESILTGLRWRLMNDILICHGVWKNDFIDAVETLALGLALRVEMGA
jgi:multimeric flavodoxin WrbA